MRAPGPMVIVSAPARHIRSSLKPPQPGQAVESGTQSATHSNTFPTMSKAPQFDTHPAVPADPGPPVTIHGAPSGVPAAVSCHSRFVRSRLPESLHACAAWNHVMHELG